jgi:hypothetical protein
MPPSLSATTQPVRHQSSDGGAGTWWTSCRCGRVPIRIVPASPASVLTAPEYGPATLITTGAATVVPSSSRTPRTRSPARPPARSIATTRVEKRNRPPQASADSCRLCAASCGSLT